MLDLDVYRSGGQAVLRGERLYAVHAADRLPFTYPPFSAVLSTPLAVLPFGADKVIWLLLAVCGPLVLVVRTGFRPLLSSLGSVAPTAFPLILAIAAYLQPVKEEFGFGQVDLLLVGLCLVDCLARSPRWPAGLLIGLATAVKLEPGVFIIYLLITGRRRAAGTAVASFAASTGLAWAISPADSVAYWGGAIFQTSRLGGNASAANQSLRGMVLRALRFQPGAAADVLWLLAVLVVGVAGFAAARACWRHGQDLAGIAITGLLWALLSPVAWIHHLCWVVVAIGVVVGTGQRAARAVIAALAGTLFLTTLPTWAERVMPPAQLVSVPGFLMENSFGLATVALIPVVWWVSYPHTAVTWSGGWPRPGARGSPLTSARSRRPRRQPQPVTPRTGTTCPPPYQ